MYQKVEEVFKYLNKIGVNDINEYMQAYEVLRTLKQDIRNKSFGESRYTVQQISYVDFDNREYYFIHKNVKGTMYLSDDNVMEIGYYFQVFNEVTKKCSDMIYLEMIE